MFESFEIEKRILFVGMIALIFDNIPKFLQLNTISGGSSNKLSWYFLFILGIFFLKKCLEKKEQFDRIDKKCLEFVLGLICFTLVSNIAGLFIYPYYEELLNGPADQIEKLPVVMKAFHSLGVNISKETGLIIWISLRAVKSSIFMVLYTYGFSFVIFKLFRNQSKEFFELIQKAVLISVIIIEAYSIIEIFYLAGNSAATWVLSIINPFLHPIMIDHGWWPPLLWKNQLRSVFCEPSRMGNYAAFALPFLWEWIISRKRRWKIILFITAFYTFLIFMTRARTAVAIYWGLLGTLVVLIFYLRNKKLMLNIIPILLVTIISLSASVGFINSFMNHEQQEETISAFMEDNLGSLTSSNKRSNKARYGLIRSNIKTGLEHPILGVGNILGTAYTVHNFNEYDLNNHEIQMWVDDYHEQGVLKYGLSAMNEYITCFASNGIIGLLFCLSPIIFGVVTLLKKIKAEKGEKQIKIATVLLALIGTAVAGCNGSLTLLYTYWIILALVYVVIFSNKEEDRLGR